MINFNNKKILIIRLSSLGDILLTTPIIRVLKNDYPDSEIHFLLKKEYKDTLLFNKYLDKSILFESTTDIKELLVVLKEEKYDYVIDLHSSLRSRLICFGLKVPVYRIKKPTLKKILLVKFKINLLKKYDYIPEMYAKAVPGLYLDNIGIDLFLSDKVQNYNPESKTIGICPGSKHFTKSWGVENYKGLISFLVKLNYKVLLFGGKSDKEICKEIASLNENIEDLSTEDNLLEMGKNMLRCKAIIGNDSGLMHAAAGLKIPVIVIFTSTVKEFGFEPYISKHLVVENNEITCRPCSHVGLDKCPKEHFNCANSIAPSFVFSQLKKFINEP